jgi:hypothetical protein
LQVNTAGATSSLLQITGPLNAATLGGTSHLVINGTGTAGSTYTILTMTAPRVGQFATVTDNVPLTTAKVIYDPFDVRVLLLAVVIPPTPPTLFGTLGTCKSHSRQLATSCS